MADHRPPPLRRCCSGIGTVYLMVAAERGNVRGTPQLFQICLHPRHRAGFLVKGTAVQHRYTAPPPPSDIWRRNNPAASFGRRSELPGPGPPRWQTPAGGWGSSSGRTPFPPQLPRSPPAASFIRPVQGTMLWLKHIILHPLLQAERVRSLRQGRRTDLAGRVSGENFPLDKPKKWRYTSTQ